MRGLGFGAGENFQGRRDGYGFAAPSGLPPVVWDAYTRLDALVYYRYRRFRFQINLDNLADRRYVEGGEQAAWIYVNPGRALKLTASYRY